jgi:hypothetical protein
MPRREYVESFLKMFAAGEFVEAMETYCAGDATMQENNKPPRAGLLALIAHERHNIQTCGR